MKFSKAVLADALTARMDWINKDWDFDPANGSSQVKGLGEDANLAYGQFRALQDILEDLGYIYSIKSQEVSK